MTTVEKNIMAATGFSSASHAALNGRKQAEIVRKSGLSDTVVSVLFNPPEERHNHNRPTMEKFITAVTDATCCRVHLYRLARADGRLKNPIETYETLDKELKLRQHPELPLEPGTPAPADYNPAHKLVANPAKAAAKPAAKPEAPVKAQPKATVAEQTGCERLLDEITMSELETLVRLLKPGAIGMHGVIAVEIKGVDRVLWLRIADADDLSRIGTRVKELLGPVIEG